MKRFFKKILKTTGKTHYLLIIFLAFISINLLMKNYLPVSIKNIFDPEKKECLLDTKFSYTQETVLGCLQNYGQVGRKKYIIFSVIDMIYPLIYSFLLASLIFKIFYYSKYNLYFFPFIGAAFDYIENIFLIFFNINFPNINKTAVFISSIITSLKWSFIIISIIILLSGIFKLIFIKKQ